jgi:ADP-ribose pyrophosphatase YjhB (NUDIX family)
MAICVCQESKSSTPRWRVKLREPIGITFRYLVVCLSCEWEWWVSANEGEKYPRLSTEERQVLEGVAKKATKDERVCSIHKLIADVCLQAEGRVLLVRYNNVEKYDWQKGWFLPDDHLNLAEHPLEAAKRILKEQVGLEPTSLELGQIESFGGAEGGFWHLVFHYKVDLGVKPNLVPSANIKSIEWFLLDQLPKRETVAHDGWAIDVIGEVFKPKS